MKKYVPKSSILGVFSCVTLAAGTFACSSGSGGPQDSGTIFGDSPSGGDSGKPKHDSGKGDSGGTHEGGKPTDGGTDAPGTTEGGMTSDASASYLLVTGQGSSQSEVVAFDLVSKQAVGTALVADDQATVDVEQSGSGTPYLLGQGTSEIWQLNPGDPGQLTGSWNVGLGGEPDAGHSGSDPYAVITTSFNSAYVIRYLSNRIDVIDPVGAPKDGGVGSYIDLSSLVQAGGDGTVEAVGGYYDSSKSRLYVVLGNIDQNTVVAPNYELICTGTVSTIAAIDTDGNTLLTGADGGLGGTGPSGTIVLKGFDPVENGVVYDATGGRLLILEAGCTPGADAGVDAGGETVQHGVEAFDLATGTTSMVLTDFPSGLFPTSLFYVSSTQAVIGFVDASFKTWAYTFNPSTGTLGSALSAVPASFAYDGNGNLVGVSETPAGDAGTAYALVSVPIAGGTTTTLLANPFNIAIDFVGAAAVFPHP